MVHSFICKASGELSKETNESKNLRWISLDELKELLEEEKTLYPMHVVTLKKYLKYKFKSIKEETIHKK